MNIVDIILDKRYGRELTDEQIAFFVKGVTDGSIPDYQVSALLMAIVLNGMNEREMTTLTMEMASSGKQNDLSYIDGIAVDKHSTGGVGDKVTPLVLPLCATYGVECVKLSGRGLGFTGGTIDKFESITGFDTSPDVASYNDLIDRCGIVISGQTPDLAPADKVLYALRDVTGTVDSIPLIASSIMSKKLAGGAGAIVLDVTCGSGAFMKTIERAEELAKAMINIGRLAGRPTVAIVTDMDQPLGYTCGNVLEMQEVYETLKGEGMTDVIEVVCTIASEMVTLAGKNNGLEGEELILDCAKRLTDGRAMEQYRKLILSQGGCLKENGVPLYVDVPHEAMRITAPRDGYISAIRADQIGRASVMLGAGRKVKGDPIDYGAGLCFYRKVGDYVKRGDVICSLCHGVESKLTEEEIFAIMESVMDAYSYSDEKPEKRDVILGIFR
ncbi:MAG: thymidine phosphorylase [Clostridiales bacterium]|nr:thymidine phosphorylase [Clostridiales bacterium]